MRLLAPIVVACALLAAAASASAGAGQTTSLYLVRPDLRLCPSPMCGGVWVRRVNHATTRCVDGVARQACYAAAVTGARLPPTSWRAGVVLARGRLEPAGIEGFPELAALAVSVSWRPAGPRPPAGTTFRVVDNGTRCITAPCFSLSGFVLETARRRTLSDVDLTPAKLSAAARRQAERAISAGGLIVTGTVRTVPDAGPAGDGLTLFASQAWFAVARP